MSDARVVVMPSERSESRDLHPSTLDASCLPNDLPKLKKWLDFVAREGEVHACDEASGAGYVLHRALRALAALPTLQPMVAILRCFRGISLHSAMVLATELVDWRRFERPGQLACHLGLISREDSSGNRQRLGFITKAGNSHCRACSCRRRGAIGIDRKRASISSVGSKANHRQ